MTHTVHEKSKVARYCFEAPDFVFPAGISLVGRQDTRDATLLVEHIHREAFEICFVATGEMWYQLGEQATVIRAGEVHLCPPGVRHAGVNQRMTPCLLFWMEILPEKLLAPGGARDFFATATCGKWWLQRPDHWRDSFEWMLTECANRAADWEEVLCGHARLLAIELAREFDQEASPRYSLPVRKVLRAMREDTLWRRPLGELVAAGGIGESALYVRFRHETGYAPHEYRMRLRIAAAEKLLTNSRLPVTTIAQQCAFTSSQYFAVVFRRQTGYSPLEWRHLKS